MKHQYFPLSKRLTVSVRIISMMNFPCYGPVHVRLALSNTRVLTLSPTGIQHTFEGTLLPRTVLQWDTVFYGKQIRPSVPGGEGGAPPRKQWC